MAGGGGTRFWPRSKAAHPKQLLALTGERTLLQIAFDRIEAIASPQRRWVVTGSTIASQVKQQLPALEKAIAWWMNRWAGILLPALALLLLSSPRLTLKR